MHDQVVYYLFHFCRWACGKQIKLIALGFPGIAAISGNFHLAGHQFIVRGGAMYGYENSRLIPTHPAIRIIRRFWYRDTEHILYWVVHNFIIMNKWQTGVDLLAYFKPAKNYGLCPVRKNIFRC